MSDANWTPQRVEMLKTLWDEGHSASQCARILGGITRNAVIGKVHRLGLKLRGTPPARGSAQQYPKRPKPTAVSEPEPEPVLLDPIPGVTIANVTDKQCRWPYGDPADREHFHLCGHPTITLSPYCAAHARKAFAPGYVRARKDEAAEELSEIYRRERVFA